MPSRIVTSLTHLNLT